MLLFGCCKATESKLVGFTVSCLAESKLVKLETSHTYSDISSYSERSLVHCNYNYSLNLILSYTFPLQSKQVFSDQSNT